MRDIVFVARSLSVGSSLALGVLTRCSEQNLNRLEAVLG